MVKKVMYKDNEFSPPAIEFTDMFGSSQRIVLSDFMKVLKHIEKDKQFQAQYEKYKEI